MNQICKWILDHKKKVILFVMLFLIVIVAFIVPKVPNYIEMYKDIQRAQIALLNDDLEGGLVSYEKAYESVQSHELVQNIEQVKALINSKSSFLKAQKYEENQNYESAYYYYQKVIPQDEKRYSEAQEKVVEIANEIVDSIYLQVEELYENRLYLMIIGRLQNALDYGVKIEETNQKIDEYQHVLFDYYLKRAQQEAKTYFNHELFDHLFMNSLEEAKKYAINDEMVNELNQQTETLIHDIVAAYYDLAMEAYQSSDLEKLEYYHQIIIELAPNSEEANQLETLIQ